MADWISFFIVIFQTCIGFLTDCTLMGVPLIGIIIAVVIICVILSAILY